MRILLSINRVGEPVHSTYPHAACRRRPGARPHRTRRRRRKHSASLAQYTACRGQCPPSRQQRIQLRCGELQPLARPRDTRRTLCSALCGLFLKCPNRENRQRQCDRHAFFFFLVIDASIYTGAAWSGVYESASALSA